MALSLSLSLARSLARFLYAASFDYSAVRIRESIVEFYFCDARHAIARDS
jgi:hypothetical protein